MEMVYFTIVAVGLYLVSDWILNQVEIKLGKRLANRSVIFFIIIIILSAVTFSVIQSLYEKPEAPNTDEKLE